MVDVAAAVVAVAEGASTGAGIGVVVIIVAGGPIGARGGGMNPTPSHRKLGEVRRYWLAPARWVAVKS